MAERPDEAAQNAGRRTLKSVAHDLGNLSYRLTFLAENLRAQIPEPGHRADALALLEDTTARMRQIIEKLRGMETDG